MTRLEPILATVRSIHDAALTVHGWQTALQSITGLLEADHAILMASDPARPDAAMATSVGMDASGLARCASPVAVQWIGSAMQEIQSGDVVTRSQVMADRLFERTDFYNDVVRPVDGFHSVGVAHQMPALSSFVMFCRSRRAGDFDAEQTALMQMLAPHFATALTVRQRFAATDLAAKSAWAALERLNTGVVVVDASAAVVFANNVAERLFGPGKLGLDREGLYLAIASANQQLRGLIAMCTDRSAVHLATGGTIEFAIAAGQSALRVAVSPFHPERIGLGAAGCSGPLALLVINDLGQERRDRLAVLRGRFGLTQAEAEFALEIVKGDGRAAAAARSNVTIGTARTHLQHIFEKTGVRRQAELVRLLLSS